MSLKVGMVVTSINDLKVLEIFHKNFVDHGWIDDVTVYAIPDLKTPESAFKRCRDLDSKGMSTRIPTLDEQDTFLASLGIHPSFVPRNSDNRRNVGYLMALADGVDFVVSIDDDNFCLENDNYIREHAVVAGEASLRRVVDSDGMWHNICMQMERTPDNVIYPRGYPYYARHVKMEETFSEQKTPVRINAGLWLLDPDVDGMTWLISPTTMAGVKEEPVVLGPNTWSPINTQNTALHIDVIPSYYFIRMGYPLGGINIDRYGDIFSGFFSQKCAKHLGHGVRVGTPLVEHRRNSHNYLNDAASEMACIQALETLLEWLTKECKLTGSDYFEAYADLSYSIQDAVEKFSGRFWTESAKGYFHQVAHQMRIWLRACKAITGKSPFSV